jgi:hypothetical protein
MPRPEDGRTDLRKKELRSPAVVKRFFLHADPERLHRTTKGQIGCQLKGLSTTGVR